MPAPKKPQSGKRAGGKTGRKKPAAKNSRPETAPVEKIDEPANPPARVTTKVSLDIADLARDALLTLRSPGLVFPQPGEPGGVVLALFRSLFYGVLAGALSFVRIAAFEDPESGGLFRLGSGAHSAAGSMVLWLFLSLCGPFAVAAALGPLSRLCGRYSVYRHTLRAASLVMIILPLSAALEFTIHAGSAAWTLSGVLLWAYFTWLVYCALVLSLKCGALRAALVCGLMAAAGIALILKS